MQMSGAKSLPRTQAPVIAGNVPFTQFVIPATASLQEGRRLTLKHGDTFAVFDQNGDVRAGQESSEGIYNCDTRHLSLFYLSVDGARPMLLSSTLRDDNATLTCDLSNPDLFDLAGQRVLDHDLIHIRRSRFLWNAACFERLAVKNFDVVARRIRLELAFAADFADLFEVRGTRRKRRGTQHPAEIRADGVTLAYTGLDDRRRETILRFDPAPTALVGDHAVFDLDLAPRESQGLFIEVRCSTDGSHLAPRRAFFVALRDARRALRTSSARAASVATSNETFNEAARRSVADLYMLNTATAYGPYPYAGIPWFNTVFGRDALITALQTLWLDPTIARGVLCYLAANQATTSDPAADAEPGKILHEQRHGEMAALGEVPFRRYYGSIDSTPLFVMLAGAYLDRTGDLDTILQLWPNIEAALLWIDNEGDRDGDGFVEYGRRNTDGLINQGWKDSHDSIFHADGTLARGPIALAEVQAYAYGAWNAGADIAAKLGQVRRAVTFRAKGETLRQKFDKCFFDETLGTYVLALDGDKRPCRVRASNAGHALFTGIAFPERAAAVVATLMTPSSFSGWGVRTLASTEARHNPMSYHNGSVWPHDNALIAAGFARYGFRREAARIFEGLFAASTYIDLRRLPELFCGFARQRNQGPTFYPVACAPQAWAAAASLSLVQSCLGLGFDPAARRITFTRAALPDFLNEVVLRNLSLGSASVDVALRRAGSEVVVNVLAREGDVRVLTVI
jgi:glycogen debranching enzyme